MPYTFPVWSPPPRPAPSSVHLFLSVYLPALDAVHRWDRILGSLFFHFALCFYLLFLSLPSQGAGEGTHVLGQWPTPWLHPQAEQRPNSAKWVA